ncbi:MAG TPA: DNA internalization-related competence protein ComEC/Rec2 [Thermodesulfobacteriota bacterium]|nr:DNA internalization-related competence protein ComEC/Rec2 [Thermodesulfobacteriota bacterium]
MDRQPHPFSLFRSSQPLIPVTLFFILGIIAASYNQLTDKLSFAFLIVSLLVMTFGIIRKWRHSFALAYIAFFLIGVILSSQQVSPYFPQNHIKMLVEHYNNGKRDEHGIGIEGVLANAPERFSDKTRLYIDAKKIFINPPLIPPFLKGDTGGFIPATGKILITVGSPSVRVKYGDRLRFISKPHIPQNFGNPGEYDYAGNLARQDIYVTGYIENERWIAVMGGEEEHGLMTSIEHVRDKIRDLIAGSDAENPAIIKALILGEKGEISKAVREAFAGTGAAHILAISGLHIGIIAFFSYWIILHALKQSERLMLAFDIKKIASAGSIVPVLLYGAIAGFSVSTQRAVIMVMVFILSVIIDRKQNLYNTLAAAAFVILVISPLSVYDISFQLSFASVLAIIYLVPRFQGLWANEDKQANDIAKLLPPHPAWHPLKNYFLNPFAVSLAASIGTAPFTAYHFHRVSIIGIIANLIAVPLMGFIAVPLGLISVLVSFFNQSAANLILVIVDMVLKASIWIVNLFSNIPYSSVFTTTPTILEAVLFYILIVSIVEFKKIRILKYALPVVMLIIIGNYSFWYYHLNYSPNLKVTFISIGQGDSALIEFPYGKRMLIDGGGFYNADFDVGERIIAPFLWKNKIDRIDYIVLSHPQRDHMMGLNFIAERFRVKEFRWNGDVSANKDYKDYKEFMKSIDKKNIKKFISDSDTPPLNINGAIVEFLSPPKESRLDTNNNSLVVKLKYKDVSFLFTGDIEDIGEAILLKAGDKIKSAVLKVPHHGSRTSSQMDFLKAVNPEFAVISVGHSNPFGFPHPEILKRYEGLKIPVLRTDINGAITVETDGARLKVSAYKN